MSTNYRILFCAAFAASLCLSGCVVAPSPVQPAQPSRRTSLGEATILGLGTAGGAAAGYAVRDDAAGAIGGAVVGLAGAAITNNVLANKSAAREAEIAEQARREERLRLQQEYWEAERYNRQKEGASKPPPGGVEEEVNYPGGYFEGINLAPRRGEGGALTEPKRPHN